MKIRDFLTKHKESNGLLSVVSILFSFLLVIIIMLITNVSVSGFFSSLVRVITGFDFSAAGTKNFFNARYIGEFLQLSFILVLTGLSVAFAFRTGLFNIGAEGQMLMGSLGAAAIGILFDLPIFLHIPLALLASAILGALWGVIPGYLKAKFGIHEVVITIMLNYVGLYTMNFFVKVLPGSTSTKSLPIRDTALLQSDFLSQLTNKSRFHWGFIIVILAILLFNYIINKRTFGYELRAVGYNRFAAEYAGMNVNSRITLSMAIAGALAGLAGAMLVLGTFGYARVLTGFENYGFDGIAVALLGGNTGFGVLFSGLLFGALKSAGPLMQVRGIPREIATIVSSLILIFVAMKYGITLLIQKMERRKDQ